MKQLFLSALLAGAAAAASGQAMQSFEGAATDTWLYTTTPDPYNFPALTDVWKDTTILGATGGGDIGITSAAAGTKFWGMQDLQNPYSEPLLGSPYQHTLDFAPVALNPLTEYTVRFKYFTNLLHGSGDSIKYIAKFDDGTDWSGTFSAVAGNSGAWDSVAIPVPLGSTNVRLRIRATINGNDDWAGIDEVQVTAGATILPVNVSFAQDRYILDEAADTVRIPVIITNRNDEPTSVKIGFVSGFGTVAVGTDVVAADTMLTWTNASPDTLYARFKIMNDASAEAAEYFALSLNGYENAEAGATTTISAYIQDNDYSAPEARKNISLTLKSSYKVSDEGSAEIVVHDSLSNRLFVVNSIDNVLHILSMADPAAPALIDTIQMNAYGGGINSVAVYKGLVAIAVESDPKTDAGKIVFLDTAGNFLKEVTAGSLPDMVAFTHDGKWLLAANEGEPDDEYATDPEGSITMVNLAGGVMSATAEQIVFTDFNDDSTALRSAGIRIFGLNATVAQDFEPEYITINKTSDTAYITLQENNAIAVLDIASKEIVRIMPLGAVDHSIAGNGLDASDQSDSVLIANWPVHGLYLPDAISNISIGGQTYLLTANEGDAREYEGLEEETRISSGSYVLDESIFPRAALLKKNYNLGRLNAVNTLGDTDSDGDFDKIYVMGGRGFTLWNAASGTSVWNSGDALEQITAADAKTGKLFNAGNEEGDNTMKNRSDNKGPEPEGITTGIINDTTYAFIALERTGGVMVYDVSAPATPVFVDYINTRDTSAFGGDQGAEGIIFIPAIAHPTAKNYVITANETSGTIAIFEVNATTPPPAGIGNQQAASKWNVYPNPVQEGILYFSQQVTGSVLSIDGRLVNTFSNASSISTAQLAAGTYFIQATGYETKKVIIK